jgi:hypothetical protein
MKTRTPPVSFTITYPSPNAVSKKCSLYEYLTNELLKLRVTVGKKQRWVLEELTSWCGVGEVGKTGNQGHPIRAFLTWFHRKVSKSPRIYCK